MEIAGDDGFRIRSYRNGASTIEGYAERISDILANPAARITDVPGIGKGLAVVLTEIEKTGSCERRDELLKKFSPAALDFLKIQGIGPKTIAQLIEHFQISTDTLNVLRARHIPVHTVGFGREHALHDVELEDAVIAPRALADSRLAAKVELRQRGYAGGKVTLNVREAIDGQSKVLASRIVTLGQDGNLQTETLMFNAGGAGARTFQIFATPLPGEENVENNSPDL